MNGYFYKKLGLPRVFYSFLSNEYLQKIFAIFAIFDTYLTFAKTLLLPRSSNWKYSIKELVLKNFAILTGKHLCWRHFFDKVTSWRPVRFYLQRPQHRCSPVTFAEFLKTPYYRTPPGNCFWHTPLS